MQHLDVLLEGVRGAKTLKELFEPLVLTGHAAADIGSEPGLKDLSRDSEILQDYIMATQLLNAVTATMIATMVEQSESDTFEGLDVAKVAQDVVDKLEPVLAYIEATADSVH